MNDVLLILGPDPYLIRACRRYGVQPVTVVETSDRSLRLGPDVKVVPVKDLANVGEVLGALTRHALVDTITGVVTADEFALVTAAALRSLLGLPGRASAREVLLRDKYLQTQAVRAAGIKTVDCVVVDPGEEFPPLPFTSGVAKPVAGAGTDATIRFDSQEEAEAALAAVREKYDVAVLFEALQKGEEYVFDGFMVDGRPAFLSIGAYVRPLLRAIDDHLPTQMYRLDPEEDAEVIASGVEFATSVMQTLDYHNGVFHMETFFDADARTFSFGECAGRRGGALTQMEVWHKYDVSLAEATIAQAIGRAPELTQTIRQGVVGTTYLPTRPGILEKAPPISELISLDGVLHAQIELPVGARMSYAATTVERIGQVLIHGKDHAEWFLRVEAVLDHVDKTVEVLPVD